MFAQGIGPALTMVNFPGMEQLLLFFMLEGSVIDPVSFYAAANVTMQVTQLEDFVLLHWECNYILFVAHGDGQAKEQNWD